MQRLAPELLDRIGEYLDGVSVGNFSAGWKPYRRVMLYNRELRKKRRQTPIEILMRSPESIRWSLKYGLPSSVAYQYAIRIKNLSMMDSIRAATPELPPDLTITASECNNLEAMRWLIERGCQIIPYASYNAANKGYIEIIQYLDSTPGYQRHPDVYMSAFYSRQKSIVRWMISVDWPRPPDYPWMFPSGPSWD
jgi:hypothetical protein